MQLWTPIREDINMKINEKEIYDFSTGSGEKIGRITHKIYSSNNYKESKSNHLAVGTHMNAHRMRQSYMILFVVFEYIRSDEQPCLIVTM